MSKIEQLIQQLCPQGVEYKRLGEVCTTLIPKIKIKAHDYLESGQYPIIDQGQEFIGGYTNEEGVFPKGKYVLFGDHTCTVKYVDFPFAQGADGLKVIVAHEKNLIPKFLYYCMCNIHIQADYARHWGKMKENAIPLPPLAVQQEIVRILDAFTQLEAQLEAELEAELEARKQQYAYYRDSLLSFDPDDPNVQWKKLGEVGTFTRGNGLQKKDFTETGVGCIHYGQIYTRYGTTTDTTISYCSPELAKRLKKARKGNLIIATTSENVEDVCKAVVWLGEKEIAVSGDACIFSHNQNPKYIGYWYQSQAFFDQKKRKATGTKVIRVSKEAMADFLIPLPPLPVQEEIVRILDKFEAITSDLQSGLPAEITARRKQYEHYRDRLLTFKRKQ